MIRLSNNVSPSNGTGVTGVFLTCISSLIE